VVGAKTPYAARRERIRRDPTSRGVDRSFQGELISHAKALVSRDRLAVPLDAGRINDSHTFSTMGARWK
jgi:hypothetical protein